MSSLKTRVYAKAVGRPPRGGDLQLSWPDLIGYMWQRGGMPRLRGLARGWRFGSTHGRLFLGARVRLMFPRYIHAGRNVLIGDDSYVSGLSTRGVRLSDNVRIREGAWIQSTSTLDAPGVGLSIGSDTYIGPRVVLGAGGGITIGARVLFGANVQILAENHTMTDPDAPIQSQGVERAGITIGDDVWIGNSVIVLDGVTIGNGAVIGAGSVVTRSVDAGAIAVGNPARVVRTRNGDQT